MMVQVLNVEKDVLLSRSIDSGESPSSEPGGLLTIRSIVAAQSTIFASLGSVLCITIRIAVCDLRHKQISLPATPLRRC
jgi:hypothetical protein